MLGAVYTFTNLLSIALSSCWLQLICILSVPYNQICGLSCSRFVLNVPKEDQQSFERILFLVEYAHWFYEDNTVEKNPSLKSLTLKEFTSLSILPHVNCIQLDARLIFY